MPEKHRNPNHKPNSVPSSILPLASRLLHDFIEASSYGERFDHGGHDVLFSLLAGCCYRGLLLPRAEKWDYFESHRQNGYG